ncbi:hypothetical protein [Insolitispirillum peregrinum]|uniref:hypothetical protein n=1 Tax=Insolitispirillum peregrinum TaxID=80876 RepID=UPI003621EB03
MEEKKKRWERTYHGQGWKWEASYVDSDNRFSLNMELKTNTPCISFPVWNGMAQYEEFYWLEDEEYHLFLHDRDALWAFVRRCKKREMDDRLMYHPGSSRGWAN